MAIPYLPNIPQPNDQLSVSQGNILTDFQGINTFVNVNHVDFTSADAGKHKWASFPVQAGDPGTTVTELALYSKNSTLTASPELFIQRANNGNAVNVTASSLLSEGWSFLPSGLLIKWGIVTVTGHVSPYTYNYPAGANIPAFNPCYTVYLIPFNTNMVDVLVWQLGAFNNVSFQLQYTNGISGQFNYFAIGTGM